MIYSVAIGVIKQVYDLENFSAFLQFLHNLDNYPPSAEDSE